MSALTFLHLSDVHFSVFEGDDEHNLEQHVRDRMLSDIEALHGQVGDMDAVLVVGDIARHGKTEDYQLASEFLDRACELVGCTPQRVICVPGNHDVDRAAHDRVHDAVRWRLREMPAAVASEELHRLLMEPRGSELLLEPLAPYNGFALRYGCDLAPDQLTWQPKQFTLGTREVLIYGLTSAWISDGSDSDEADQHKVLLGEFQCGQVASHVDAISIALVHHPPNWLRDASRASGWLARARLVLTGHEHAAGITPDAAHRSLAIASGAVNPNRTDSGWIPAYNVIGLELRDEDGSLGVDVHVRCWQNDRAEFGPDARFEENPYKFTIRLGGDVSDDDDDIALSSEPPVSPPEPIESDVRAMIFRIMRAPPDVRLEAAQALGLVAIDTLRGLDMDRQILHEAIARNKLAELGRRISG